MHTTPSHARLLFGGAIFTAGLAGDALAQSLDLLATDARAYSISGDLDVFSGPGEWSVDAYYPAYLGWGYAGGFGTASSISGYAYGYSDTFVPNTVSATVTTRFTVSDDATATVEWVLDDGFFFPPPGQFRLRDLTDDVTFVSATTGDGGSLQVRLLAGHEYQYTSLTWLGRTSLAIPAPPACALLAPVSLLPARRRRS